MLNIDDLVRKHGGNDEDVQFLHSSEGRMLAAAFVKKLIEHRKAAEMRDASISHCASVPSGVDFIF